MKLTSEVINKWAFGHLTTDERKEKVEEKLNSTIAEFEKLYKTKPTRVSMSPELSVHLVDSKEMVLEKKNYNLPSIYIIEVDLHREIYKDNDDIPKAWY